MLIIFISLGVFQASNTFFHQHSRVLYSLDKKQNDQEIINLINNAEKYIYFATYIFTKDNIADALIAAKLRGVDVQGITDAKKAQEPYQKAIIERLRKAGITVETQCRDEGIMHIKAIVTDKAYAIGSYNWTQSATVLNDELLEIGTDKSLHNQYLNILKRIILINAPDYCNHTAPSSSKLNTTNQNQNNTLYGATKQNSEIKIYDYTKAPDHIGEYAGVKGKVIKVYTSAKGTTFLDFCWNYRTCPFGAVIFPSSAKNFKDISRYEGRLITIFGQIKPYQGRAEIILNTPDQIVQ
ncbi:MAG: phospholipase D-like domain-containing protein [Dissulfurimicrobium sp.]|uniref:phospholipase D-like domain-containing protein n=1 Tax=Dissulfurimicrobium sp. TaxID=2022436 RepID=UPI00404A8C1A